VLDVKIIMNRMIASILLLIVSLNIFRKIAIFITKAILFKKEFIKLIVGIIWGFIISFLVSSVVHFVYAGKIMKIIWYLAGTYMAYVSFGDDKKITDSMAIVNACSVITYIIVVIIIYLTKIY